MDDIRHTSFGSEAYPLNTEREYRLYELDNENIRLITGMDYEEFRLAITRLDMPDRVKSSMFGKYWFTLLDLPAETFWAIRQLLETKSEV